MSLRFNILFGAGFQDYALLLGNPKISGNLQELIDKYRGAKDSLAPKMDNINRVLNTIKKKHPKAKLIVQGDFNTNQQF